MDKILADKHCENNDDDEDKFTVNPLVYLFIICVYLVERR